MHLLDEMRLLSWISLLLPPRPNIFLMPPKVFVNVCKSSGALVLNEQDLYFLPPADTSRSVDHFPAPTPTSNHYELWEIHWWWFNVTHASLDSMKAQKA